MAAWPDMSLPDCAALHPGYDSLWFAVLLLADIDQGTGVIGIGDVVVAVAVDDAANGAQVAGSVSRQRRLRQPNRCADLDSLNTGGIVRDLTARQQEVDGTDVPRIDYKSSITVVCGNAVGHGDGHVTAAGE